MLYPRPRRTAVRLTGAVLTAGLACVLLSGELAYTAELGSGDYPYPFQTAAPRLCRAIKTSDLPPQQLVGFKGRAQHTNERLKPAGTQDHDVRDLDTPVPVGEWQLWIEDPRPGYLGLQNWNSSHPYGSPEADRIRKQSDKVRISLSTVPITGNHWLRALVSGFTREGTCAVWPEGDAKWTGNGDSLDQMMYCQSEQRGRAKPESVFFVKNHVPFQALIQKDFTYDPQFDKVSFRMMTVRNPFDSHRSWQKFMHSPWPLQKYTWAWAGHYGYHNDIKTIPLFAIRYEDMVIDTEAAMGAVFNNMPPGTFEFAPANLAHALRVAPVQQGSMFEDMCGRGMLNMSHSEIRFVQEQYSGLLTGYGYKLIFVPASDARAN